MANFSFDPIDIVVTLGFVAALAAAALLLLYSRRGKAVRSQIDDMQARQDQELYESKGKVREPPAGPLP